jgi:hypothetical protein
MWIIDPAVGVATLLCGLGCLSKDPGFVDTGEEILTRYTMRQLQNREEQDNN